MLEPSILIGSSQPSVATGPAVLGSTSETAAMVQRLQESQTHAQALATIVELQSRLDSVDQLNDAALIAAGSLKQSLAASRVLIAWRSAPNEPCRMIADSNESTPERSGDFVRLALSAAEESAVRGALTKWPAEGNKNRHALAAVAQFARSVSAASVLAAALVDELGNDRGAVLAIDSDSDQPEPAAAPENLLDAIRAPLATKLAATERMQPGRIESLVRSGKEFVRFKKRKLAAAIIVIVGAVMLLPLHYRIAATCQLQPVERRFVAAPFDGPLDAALVRPGDVVLRGDLLARINPREIEFELAGVRADFSRAQQEQKGLMAEHDIAGSTIAGLESERLRLETELLEYRRDNLEIRSPLSGVVVSGDLKQSEGTPLTRGETLFEIAPLGEMVVEIAIAESDFDHARAGMPVDFYVHAIPGRRFKGKLGRIHPRAELREHDNVFIGEVKIVDPEGVLRPGMRGRARITSDRHPLGWNLFHKAYYALRSAVGW